jgi:hypothetical protein
LSSLPVLPALSSLPVLPALSVLPVLPALLKPQARVLFVRRQPSYRCNRYNLNFTGLSVLVPLNTDRFARAFSRTRIG